MSSKKYRNKQCVYCGQLATTGDHIPPASLFASPRPNNLIKVPSCKACNDGASKDDEYFRVQLALREDMRGHPDVEGVLPDVIRGLENPAKHKFKEALV